MQLSRLCYDLYELPKGAAPHKDFSHNTTPVRVMHVFASMPGLCNRPLAILCCVLEGMQGNV